MLTTTPRRKALKSERTNRVAGVLHGVSIRLETSLHLDTSARSSSKARDFYGSVLCTLKSYEDDENYAYWQD